MGESISFDDARRVLTDVMTEIDSRNQEENKMGEKISGTVENINSKKRNGICIDGVWYNATPRTKGYVAKIEKGDVVELEVDGQSINYLKINSSGGTPRPQEQPRPVPVAITKSAEDKATIINDEIDNLGNLMLACKTKVDKLFGEDEKYKDSMGQHCNSLFIALERGVRSKGGI